MTTASDQISGALRLIGQLAEGEEPSSETANDALTAFNQMVDSWNTERLSVFTTQTQSFVWPANQISRTLGPSGNFVGNRPISLDDATYFVGANGVSYSILIINQEQYDGIALKTVTSTYAQVLYVDTTYPNVTLYQYPVANAAQTWYFVSVQELEQPATLSTVLSFPPGYLRAFRYNLACELAPEFGVEPSAQVQRVAMVSKRDLKRINFPGDVMSMPATLVTSRQRFNIYSGGFT